MMQITIVYDNTVFDKRLKADWGFACVIDRKDTPRILFDTGAKGAQLLRNMEILNIDPASIDVLFVSHYHWDHTGGIEDFLRKNPQCDLFLPAGYILPTGLRARSVKIIKDEPLTLFDGVHTSGILDDIEQSLFIETSRGVVIVSGCSHAGLELILEAVKEVGVPYGLVGGLHSFSELNLLMGMQVICPVHCAKKQEEIGALYRDAYRPGGAGRILDIDD
jgi:7,8-dihydropterin-6-yl-methyl-4-(beta-D-ribofuranosyl)aminobenzene 5'-phosphate synthase